MTNETPAVRRAHQGDLGAILTLLEANRLPVVGVAESLDGFFVAIADDVVGVIGIEACGEAFGLLRSAVVAKQWRGKGVGSRLVAAAVNEAESREYQALYLLTTTAEEYFPAFGFTVADRDEAPAEVRATAEFRGACPASATMMVRAMSGA